MPDPADKQATAEIKPIPVAIIGTGDGGVAAPLSTGTVATTPDHQPNLAVTVITPIVAILVRFVNTFLTSLLGILTGAMATNVISASDFLHLLYKCAGLAVAGAIIGLLKDCVTVFGKLEGKFPLATGSI